MLSGVTAKLNRHPLNRHPCTLSVPFIKKTNKQTNKQTNLTATYEYYTDYMLILFKSKNNFQRHLSKSDISHQVQHKLIRIRHIHTAVRLMSSCQTGTEVSCTWTKHKFIPRQSLTIHVHLVTKCGVHKPLTKYYDASFRPGVARISSSGEETKLSIEIRNG